ncbi:MULTISPECIES: DUF1828 domain-containing protein [Lactobacillus]|uniref:DUF1828 domain-containing protein n=1 Tax=Lactobacillus xujianguonis TaxID=2495899 RepID=A0A437SW87_9LACO|nr:MULTISPECIES: DUF1828 domain-containing protein [Lactobacillus]RVU71198.1 DUF1828 domain-containing protein [Lactobacillus xujianguonis]RVU74121.1 DUF1828 domain-containing protein [Lactobacillus xujianguonis]
MLENDVATIAKDWLSFLKDQYNLKLIDQNHIVLTTPITDAFDDGITVMISLIDSGDYMVSDQGYTIWNLESRGINVMKKNSNRQKNVMSIIKSENVKLSSNNDIYLIGKKHEIAQMIFNVIQAVIKIGNLGFSNFNSVRGMFLDDVTGFFETNKDQFHFLKGLQLQGKTGLSYNIDYLFMSQNPKSKVTKIYDGLAKNTVEQLLGIWFDTESIRNSNGENMEFDIIIPSLSDERQKEFANNLKSHNIIVSPFDNKEIIKNNFSFKAA